MGRQIEAPRAEVVKDWIDARRFVVGRIAVEVNQSRVNPAHYSFRLTRVLPNNKIGSFCRDLDFDEALAAMTQARDWVRAEQEKLKPSTEGG